MSSPERELTIDRRVFYTRQDAAVQILCSLHGVKRRKYISEDPALNSKKQYPYLDTLSDSVRPLTELHVKALVKAAFAERDGESTETIQKLYEDRDYYLEMANLHDSYRKAIDSDYMEGNESTLTYSEKDGVSYIRRFDLHQWICSKYRVKLIGSSRAYPHPKITAMAKPAILEASDQGGSSRACPPPTIAAMAKPEIPSSNPTTEVSEVGQSKNEIVPKGGLSKTVAENVFMTFASLIEQCSATTRRRV